MKAILSFFKTNNEENEEENEIIEEKSEIISENFDSYIRMKHSIYNNLNLIKFNINGLYYLERWNLQRTIDENHVNNFENFFLEEYEKNNEIRFLSPIQITYNPNTKKRSVIDGQHRLCALEKINNERKFIDIEILANEHLVNNEIEEKILFTKINSNRPIILQELDLDKSENIILEMKNVFGDVFGINRPRIYSPDFINSIRQCSWFNNKSAKEIVLQLKKANDFCESKSKKDRIMFCCNYLKNNKNDKYPQISSSINEKCEKIRFFLSYDKKFRFLENLF